MTTIAGDSLALLQLSLELAVDQLTVDETHRVEHDGEMKTVTLPSLLEQVADAVDSDQREVGAFTPTSKPPLRIDALDLLDEIDRTAGTKSDADRGARVRGWSARCHSLTVLGDLQDVALVAERWVARARAVLEPTPPRVLRGKRCPTCLATSVPTVDAAGDRVRRPPLEVDPWSGGARCVGEDCGARWSVNELEALADQIERVEEQIRRQTEHEHLAEDA